MANFTPGPWDWEESTLSQVADRTSFLAGGGSNVLIHRAAWEISAEDKALIAAAPEMYEALKQVTEICEDGDTGADFGRVVAAMVRASKAIAKAEGGAQ